MSKSKMKMIHRERKGKRTKKKREHKRNPNKQTNTIHQAGYTTMDGKAMKRNEKNNISIQDLNYNIHFRCQCIFLVVFRLCSFSSSHKMNENNVMKRCHHPKLPPPLPSTSSPAPSPTTTTATFVLSSN